MKFQLPVSAANSMETDETKSSLITLNPPTPQEVIKMEGEGGSPQKGGHERKLASSLYHMVSPPNKTVSDTMSPPAQHNTVPQQVSITDFYNSKNLPQFACSITAILFAPLTLCPWAGG